MSTMQPEMVRQHLELVERHVWEGEICIARQRQIIARLEQRGLNADEARTLLAQFEELQAAHLGHRDRLLRLIGGR